MTITLTLVSLVGYTLFYRQLGLRVLLTVCRPVFNNSAVDKIRNMEHSGTSRNIPEHPGTSNNYHNYARWGWGYLARSELLAVSRKKISPKVMSYINPLLTKLVRSRWVDIGLVLFFLRVHGPRFRLGQLQRKRYHFGYYPAILTIRLVNMAVSQKDWELQNSRI